MIGGEIRTIDFKNESAGTQHILEIIYSLLGAFCGVTVVYDEIDDGIHDLLLKNILESMTDDISGQLIITAHNTYLLESIDIKSVYFITTELEKQGNKLVKENLLTANDPNHYLQAMIFKNKSYFSVIIVELYKENIYQSSIQCQELEKAYDFSLKIMQSFTKP